MSRPGRFPSARSSRASRRHRRSRGGRRWPRRGERTHHMEHLAYPNESADYRTARNALLDAEMALRRQIEEVAALRRALPPGGVVDQDYVFERIGAHQRPERVTLSELFDGKPSLILYSFMYG